MKKSSPAGLGSKIHDFRKSNLVGFSRYSSQGKEVESSGLYEFGVVVQMCAWTRSGN